MCARAIIVSEHRHSSLILIVSDDKLSGASLVLRRASSALPAEQTRGYRARSDVGRAPPTHRAGRVVVLDEAAAVLLEDPAERREHGDAAVLDLSGAQPADVAIVGELARAQTVAVIVTISSPRARRARGRGGVCGRLRDRKCSCGEAVSVGSRRSPWAVIRLF